MSIFPYKFKSCFKSYFSFFRSFGYCILGDFKCPGQEAAYVKVFNGCKASDQSWHGKIIEQLVSLVSNPLSLQFLCSQFLTPSPSSFFLPYFLEGYQAP